MILLRGDPADPGAPVLPRVQLDGRVGAADGAGSAAVEDRCG